MNPNKTRDEIKQLMIDYYVDYNSIYFHFDTNKYYYYHLKNNVIFWIEIQYFSEFFDSYIDLYHLIRSVAMKEYA